MTPAQKIIARTYVKKEIVKFLSENQDRITAEIKAIHGFDPDNIEGSAYVSDTTAPAKSQGPSGTDSEQLSFPETDNLSVEYPKEV